MSLKIKFSAATMMLTTTLVSIPSVSRAADGDLDPLFNSGSAVVTNISANKPDTGNAVALQSDGKIVVAGVAEATNNDFAVVRYNTNGSPDSDFDVDGTVTTGFGGSSIDSASAVTVQADGKILAAGYANANSGDFAFARYNADGSLDTTFDGESGVNGNGKVTTNFGTSTTEYLRAVAIQNDDRIVAAGFTSSNNGNFAIARYNADGSLDTTFDGEPGVDGNGKVTTDFGTNTNDDPYSLAVQSDGKILVAGTSTSNFAVARYNPDGSLDNSFSSDGKVTTDSGLSDSGYSMVVQPDGKIVVVGQVGFNASANFGLVRYNSDGTLDTTFDGESGVNGNGRVTTDIGSGTEDRANAVAVQADGKIVVAGYTLTSGTTSTTNFAVVRYNADGSLDATFGSGGKITTDIGSSTQDQLLSMAIQPDGKIVAAGWSGTAGDPTSRNFAVVRYIAVPLTATLATPVATSPTASLLFTVTGTGNLDCATLSATAGVDFNLTGISTITAITQTNPTTCTIAATSAATAGGGAVTSTLAVAPTFSIDLTKGNYLRTLAGATQSVTVTIPNPQSVVDAPSTDKPAGNIGNTETTSGGSTNTTSSSSLTVGINKSTTARSIANHAKLKVSASSKLTLRIAASSRKTCRVAGTSIRGLKAGSCKVTVIATPKRGKPTSKTVTLKVAK